MNGKKYKTEKIIRLYLYAMRPSSVSLIGKILHATRKM